MNRGAGLLPRLRGNGNLNVGTLFGPYFFVMIAGQVIFNTEISIPAVGPFGI